MLNVSVRDEHYALFAGSKDAFDKIAHYIYHVCWLKGDVEMRQSIWSPFEVALLIDTYWRIKNNHIAKREAVSEISALFRNYAIAQGRDIDDTYRNPESVKSTFIIGQQKREQFLQLKRLQKCSPAVRY